MVHEVGQITSWKVGEHTGHTSKVVLAHETSMADILALVVGLEVEPFLDELGLASAY